MDMSQTWLASLVFVSPKTISAYELGNRKPSLKVMVRIAKALKIPANLYIEYYI